MPRYLLSVLFVFCLILPTFAQEKTLDGAEEARAKNLFLELRCVVCQNQSIGDSDADVARDLREIVREQIAAGKSNSQIKQFLVDRYGEFILLKPVFALHTLLLWVAPIVLLLLGGLLAWRVMGKRTKQPEPAGLSEKDEADLEKIINDYKA